MKTLRCDLNKSINNPGFFGAVIVITLLCFASTGYNDTSVDRCYSAFEMLLNENRRIVEEKYMISSVLIFQQAFSGYITMFMPMIVAFPFMMTFCSERSSGLMRFAVTRSGQVRYCISKAFSAVISGGLAVMMGVMLFGILTAILFPDISDCGVSEIQMEWILPNGYLTMIWDMLVTAFLYGAVSTLPALFLSSFCKNPYIITCLPFMLDYVRDTAIDKQAESAMSSEDYDLAMKFRSFSSSAIVEMSTGEFDKMVRTALIFNGITAVILIAGFVVIMQCRQDKGV